MATLRGGDSTKAGRVKRRITKGEVCVVQNVDERRLYFKTDALANREALSNTRVKIEEPSRIYAVQRKVPKRAGCGLSQQSGFECCANHAAGIVECNVQHIRVEPEYAARRSENPHILRELFECHTQKLGGVSVDGAAGPIVKAGATRGNEERWPCRPGNDTTDRPTANRLIDERVRPAQIAASSAKRKIVKGIGHEPVRLVVTRAPVVETLVAERSEILQSALVIALSIRSVGKSLAEGIVCLEHQAT